MAARRSEKIFSESKTAPEVSAAPEADEDAAPAAPASPEPATRRVLSVSPSQDEEAGRADGPDRSLLGNGVRAGEVFISPRVVDQRAFDELAAALRSLIDEAGGASGTLRKLIAQSKDSDKWTGKASQHLQERLRLSARMLKAFQAQITRVEQSIERMEQQEQALEAARGTMDESLEEFEHHLSASLERFERRMAESAKGAIERFDQHLAARRDDLDRIERQIVEAQKRADITLSVAEEVEASVTRLAHRTAENAASIEARTAEAKTGINRELARLTDQAAEAMGRFETSAAELRALLQRGEAATKGLNAELDDTELHIEEANVRCRGIRCALEAKLDQCREAERAFEQRFAAITELVSSLEVDAKMYESLHELLARLAPWESVLLRAEGEHAGLPESVAAMIDELRGGIGRDLARLSKAMTDIARRIEQTGLAAAGRASETAELKPHAERTSTSMQSAVGETISEIETLPGETEAIQG